MKNINIPGFVWTLLLVIAAALLQANFENAVWYQTALILLFAIAKMIDVTGNTEKEIDKVLRGDTTTRSLPQDAPYITAEYTLSEEQPGKMHRFLLK